MAKTESGPPEQGERAAAISNLVVQLISDHTGRGPTRARTYINDGLVTVVLRDALTKGEQSLLRDGRSELVMGMRQAFQQTMRDGLVAGVEAIMGRRVEAFLSANSLEPDIAIESFVLARVSEDGPEAD